MTDMVSITNDSPELDVRTNLSDLFAQLLKISAGLVPIPGVGAIAELLASYIPDQKAKRVEEFLEILNAQLQYIKQLDARLNKDQVADLLETAVRQASETFSRGRRELIAQTLKNGLTMKEIHFANKKRLMEIAGSLNDIEVILLQSTSLWATEEQEFEDFHNALWQSAEAEFDASTEEHSGETMLTEYWRSLASRGLVDANRKPTLLGELLLVFMGINHESRQPGAYAGQWFNLIEGTGL